MSDRRKQRMKRILQNTFMTKRLRIFCGPNSFGKSTLFLEFIKKFNSGLFVNSDNIESEISEKKILDQSSFNLDLT